MNIKVIAYLLAFILGIKKPVPFEDWLNLNLG